MFVQAGLSRIAHSLSALSEPCVLVRTHAYPYEALPVGASRIGGMPDLPPTVDWPLWKGQPLGFLAQFNLNDLSQFACCRELPSTGHLWFFYVTDQGTWGFDPQHRASWRVLYADTMKSDLETRKEPE